MITRKLIKSGQSSLVISLPNRWLEQNKLNKGDLIFIDSAANNLILKPFLGSAKEKSEFVIGFKPAFKPYLEQLLYSAYLSDKKEIVFKSLKDKQYYEILRAIKDFPLIKLDERGEDFLRFSFMLDLSNWDIEKEANKTLVHVGSFLDYLISLQNSEGTEETLQELYEQLSDHIILLMRAINVNFQVYDKTILLRVKQQVDSYYFLLKACKKLMQEYLLNGRFDKECGSSISRIKGILEKLQLELHRDSSLGLLELMDTINKDIQDVLLVISDSNGSRRLKYLMLINNNMLEIAKAIIYAQINNVESYC